MGDQTKNDRARFVHGRRRAANLVIRKPGKEPDAPLPPPPTAALVAPSPQPPLRLPPYKLTKAQQRSLQQEAERFEPWRKDFELQLAAVRAMPPPTPEEQREIAEYWAKWEARLEAAGGDEELASEPPPGFQDPFPDLPMPPMPSRWLAERRVKDEVVLAARASEVNQRRGNRFQATGARSVVLDNEHLRASLMVGARLSSASLSVTGIVAPIKTGSKKVSVIDLDILGGNSIRLASVGITCDGEMELPALSRQLRLRLLESVAEAVTVEVVDARGPVSVVAPKEWIVRRLLKGRTDNRKPRGGR